MTFELIKGQKYSITKDNPLLTHIIIGLGWQAAGAGIEIDSSAVLLTEAQRVSTAADLIFYGNPAAHHQSVVLLQPEQRVGTGVADRAQIAVRLDLIPAEYERIAFVLTIHEAQKRQQSFSSLDGAYLRIMNAADGTELLRYPLEGGYSVETAIVAGELYRYRSEWRFSAVGSGYAGGLHALCHSYGIPAAEAQSLVEAVKPEVGRPEMAEPEVPSRKSPFVLPELRSRPKQGPGGTENPGDRLLKNRGETVRLQNGPGAAGEIVINLNWAQTESSSWFGRKSIDLDLGCLFELSNGLKGAVQALGESFGSFSRPPYIILDGDDRTGTIATGENLRINSRYLSEIKRIVIFALIYEGAASWSQAGAVVTIRQQGGPEIKVQLDEHNNDKGMCAIAMLHRQPDGSFCVERLVEYFSGHEELDQRYQWNLRWEAGSK
ncbi:tellurium resistance protein terA [Paenibacillus sp. FSL R7-277]|uniref:TerD family protein n=1 Tax=Paenibacillus sp. FSL R7-277 TaxID=1227352 RepID=UPI0003E1E7E2|nr:TerD family protein [Paenibacillus sp. FSL R7-277]ETT73027.1 tellurium resistance protein terA [Paenibacillus sp. FSL R7-277]